MANKLYKPLLIDSVLATADLPKQRFISFNGAVSGAGEKAYGICDVETESGQYAPVATTGILLVGSFKIVSSKFLRDLVLVISGTTARTKDSKSFSSCE